MFPYFYGLVGDRNPRQAPKATTRSGYSPLAVDTFHIIKKEGPISKYRLREMLGSEISEAALDRALDELWAKLRITRVDYKQDEGVFWDVLFRWSPDAVKEGMHVSVAESLTALVSKYLDCVLAAQQEEIENFFSPLIGRARVREAINALQAARELSFVHVGGRVMLQVSSLQDSHCPSDSQDADKSSLGDPLLLRRRGRPLVEHRPGRRRTVETLPSPGPVADRDERAQAGDRHRWPGRLGQEHHRRPAGEEAWLHQPGKRRHVSRARAEGDGEWRDLDDEDAMRQLAEQARDRPDAARGGQSRSAGRPRCFRSAFAKQT